MPTLSAIPSAEPIRLPAMLPDGQVIELTITRAAALQMVGEITRVKAPIVGYAALRAALAGSGIKISLRTLQEQVSRRRLPCRRFGRKVSFYLDEVLQKIGGRG